MYVPADCIPSAGKSTPCRHASFFAIASTREALNRKRGIWLRPRVTHVMYSLQVEFVVQLSLGISPAPKGHKGEGQGFSKCGSLRKDIAHLSSLGESDHGNSRTGSS